MLVVGGGTGGTAAAIASARAGAQTILVEEGPWLGGMISSAGVTCTDGNHNLPSGIWNEFRNHLYGVYGGPKAVATGWVSMTQFEPHVSDSIWKWMARQETKLTVLHGYQFTEPLFSNNAIKGATFRNTKGETLTVKAFVTIDATELGDVMAASHVPYDLGMEADSISHENVGITSSNSMVQDLTWVAVLKDYGARADCTIVRPAGYTPDEFDASCSNYYQNKNLKAPTVDAQKMLNYGRLPHGKFMINWPIAGNDTYLNVVEMSFAQRQIALEQAKQTTLRFVYFIQYELGFKNLGLADDEFPTKDRLALMPYYREGRRLQGIIRMNIHHIAAPYTYGEALYRTGISVGDYPIDHHHKKNPAAPQHLDFYPVPSYNIPLGSLIPRQIDGLIVAEKGISVSNVVNGTTRLQPVVMLTGQAAGVLAALSARQKQAPREIPVRKVQQLLLESGAYLMPYYDVKPTDPHFTSIQRIGATGMLKGKGIPFQWANQTWFYPDSAIISATFLKDWKEVTGMEINSTENKLIIGEALKYAYLAAANNPKAPFHGYKSEQQFLEAVAREWSNWALKDFDVNRTITRRELSVMLDHTIDPFHSMPVDHHGKFTSN